MANEWHKLEAAAVLSSVESSEQGLTRDDAASRLAAAGPNTLPETPRESSVSIFFRQFQSPLIYLLLIASALVYALGEMADALIILVILVFNAVVGTIQEGRAQQTLSALATFTKSNATVRRSGAEFSIPDTEVVVGDIILVREGDRVPADARILETRYLKTNESALTGESVPVSKKTESMASADNPADRHNMLYRGTHVVAGYGVAVVVATGRATYIGSIAERIRGITSEIPLQTSIKKLSQRIIVVVLALSALLFALGLYQGQDARTMFSTVVSLTVSVVPEGLPIVLTLILATGVWRMSKRQALVKKLQAVEALGHARVIAVDKTGTITRNEMLVTHLYAADTLYTVTGSGYEAVGEFFLGEQRIDPANHPELLRLGKIIALTANARVSIGEGGQHTVMGDPTEAAAVVAAKKLGFDRSALENESPLAAELPFDSSRKYAASVHGEAGSHHLTVMGAPEVILALCEKARTKNGAVPMSEAHRAALEREYNELSLTGVRVIALAEQESPRAEVEHVKHLTFAGFLGMKDPLRPEVKGAMDAAREAGMRVVMITGDHATTARAIAKEAGIYREGDTVLTGADLERMSKDALAAAIGTTSVFARVTPEHKLQIIEGYKARREVIAMTGDGVNDAPSLVAADLGVSMGKIGTEVAKEASDIVLLDDNFGSIVAAIEEGRSIYRTIKKVILYLFSTSVGEALTITLALVAALPLPLLASQIIWLNFVTDGFLTVALAMEPKERDLLKQRFTSRSRSLFDAAMFRRMMVMALPMSLGTLFVFVLYLEDVPKALTMSVTTLAIVQWINAWNCRSERESVFTMNPFSNLWLIAATALVAVLQVLAVYHPLLQGILHTVPLTAADWLLSILVASSILWVEEIRKLAYRLTHVLLPNNAAPSSER